MANTIFIKNLHGYINAANLCDEFRRYGNILKASIECDDDGQSLCEGYITFKEFFSASDSVKYMNGTRKLGYPMYVTLSIQEKCLRKVFIKNFSDSWDECNLLKAFEKFGEIENIKIYEELGKSKGYGFILFKSSYSAKTAIECMNGKMFKKHKLIVEHYKSKLERENIKKYSLEFAKEMLQKSTQFNNLHIKNLPKDLKEDDLINMFKKYGKISNVKIETNEAGASKGFGFVSFENTDDARKAQQTMNDFILNGKKLEINFKEDRNARRHYLKLKERENQMNIKHYRKNSYSMSSLQLLPSPLYSLMNNF